MGSNHLAEGLTTCQSALIYCGFEGIEDAPEPDQEAADLRVLQIDLQQCLDQPRDRQNIQNMRQLILA